MHDWSQSKLFLVLLMQHTGKELCCLYAVPCLGWSVAPFSTTNLLTSIQATLSCNLTKL